MAVTKILPSVTLAAIAGAFSPSWATEPQPPDAPSAASRACAAAAAHPRETDGDADAAVGVAMEDISVAASGTCMLAASQTAATAADHYRYARVLYKMQNWTDEVREVTLAAEAGHALAQYLLGDQYLRGDGVPADPQAAAQWLTKAAMQRVPPAMYFIGVMFRDGSGGMARNNARGLELIRNSATVGLAEAELDLGDYFRRQGNFPTALQYFAAAAQQGEAVAMTGLADLQWTGQGGTADQPAALRNYRRAADLGNEAAKARLAELAQAKPQAHAFDDDGPGEPRSLLPAEKSNERTWR